MSDKYEAMRAAHSRAKDMQAWFGVLLRWLDLNSSNERALRLVWRFASTLAPDTGECAAQGAPECRPIKRVTRSSGRAAAREQTRYRCHKMFDALNDPELEARAYRFIQYLYIHEPSRSNYEEGGA